ncbi:MAG: DUF1326 domain-containing protein [Pseudomonadota bacterium]|nr:DUF1326 domain-containing protein [Pseudomonadota bacterium]
MATVDWRMQGRYVKNCNCAFGCPWDFNARPTHGHCQGMFGMHIDQGDFGATRLNGLRWAGIVHFPGALHEGNGTMQAIIDERADEQQRQALLTILSGKEQEEGTLFWILSQIVSNFLEPKFAPIEFEFNCHGRTACVSIPGVLEASSEPIKNPETGAPSRVLVRIPEGFEYFEAEIASSTAKSTGDVKFDFAGRHSSLAHLQYTPWGVA